MNESLEELKELYNLAVKAADVPRAMAINHRIKEIESAERIEREERQQLIDALRVIDGFGLSGSQLNELLSDMNGEGGDE
ncbi:hypothetical protein ACTXLQ_12675 [Enterococcus hirae]|uniref:hypothetical protein n=1 Tax=Enterococcus hirae TaxID=1354 RepID=UPI003FD45446